MRIVPSTFVAVLVVLPSFFTATSAGSIDVSVWAAGGPSNDSPNWDDFGENLVTSAENNGSSVGTPGTPAHVSPTAEMTGKDFIATSFESWRADADPSGSFAGESGNLWAFFLNIKGDGSTQFRLNDIEVSVDSTDSNNWFDDTDTFSGSYIDTINGIDWGDDNAPGGTGANADTRYESGNGTTFVDQIVGFASWGGFTPDPAWTGSNQDLINQTLAAVNGETPFTITAEYTVNGIGGGPLASGSETITINSTPVIPEPSSGILVAMGLSMIAAGRRRKTRKV